MWELRNTEWIYSDTEMRLPRGSRNEKPIAVGVEMAKAEPAKTESGEKYTSTRLFEADSFEMGMLAHKLKMSVANFFRTYFAPQVHEHLIKVTREELRRLESRPK